MKRSSLGIAIAGLTLAFALAPPAQAVSLQSLIDTDGTIVVGDKVFSDFSCQVAGTGATLSCADINVTGFTTSPLTGVNDIGLNFQADFTATDGLTADYALGYTVTVTDPNFAIDQLSLAFNPGASGTGGQVSVVETVNSGNAIVGNISVSQSLTSADLQDPPYEGFDIPLNGLYTTLNVIKDIGLTANAGGTVFFSLVDQDFRQRGLPEPASLLLLSTVLGGIALGARRRSVRAA